MTYGPTTFVLPDMAATLGASWALAGDLERHFPRLCKASGRRIGCPELKPHDLRQWCSDTDHEVARTEPTSEWRLQHLSVRTLQRKFKET